MSDHQKEIAKINQKKYLYPPTWEEIENFVNELGVGYHAFERFYGIYFHCLTQIKRGDKQLPVAAWHFVYEKIKPTYGSGFIEDYNKKQLSQITSKTTSYKKPQKAISQQINNPDTHDRISSLK